MTYRQTAELGAQVRKGEHGSLVVYANSVTRTETDDEGEEHERSIPFMKGYTVFNVEQIDGLPSCYQTPAAEPLSPPARIAAADQFAAATRADIWHGGNRAFYAPVHDVVQMPPFEAFCDAERYYGRPYARANPLTHWTSRSSRLDRHFEDGHRFGSAGYAFEELVAELGAAFVCADIGITPEVRKDHAAYWRAGLMW